MNNSFKTIALLVAVATVPMRAFFDMPDETALMHAAQAADIVRVTALIAAGEDVNAVYGRDFPRMGYPVLRYAIDSKSEEMVKLLLQHGADPDMQTTSPIMHPDIQRGGANVRNLPLLSYAIQSGASIEIIKLLIQYGADVNQKTIMNEWTPLMVAAYYGNYAAVELLLVAGADYTAKNNCDGKRTAYDYAYEVDNQQSMNDLLETIEWHSIYS